MHQKHSIEDKSIWLGIQSIIGSLLLVLALGGCEEPMPQELSGKHGALPTLGKPAQGVNLPSLEPVLMDGFELDVHYGVNARQTLDFWVANPNEITPLVVYIHGGGFVAGCKKNMDLEVRDSLLAAGISVASINYRFITTNPLPAPMLDAARAIQFLREKGKSWRIDPERVAAMGGSAGACIAMWIGLHDDMAIPGHPDPIRQQSTRLQAIAQNGGQSSLDPLWMQMWIPGGNTHLHENLPLGFGVENYKDLFDLSVRQKIIRMSPINHVSRDDPPIYMVYAGGNGPLPSNAEPAAGIHHRKFGVQLKRMLDNADVEAVLVIGGEPRGTDPYGSRLEFLIQKLLN